MFPLNEYAKIKNLLLEVKLLVLRSVHLLHDEEKQTQPTLKKTQPHKNTHIPRKGLDKIQRKKFIVVALYVVHVHKINE